MLLSQYTLQQTKTTAISILYTTNIKQKNTISNYSVNEVDLVGHTMWAWV